MNGETSRLKILMVSSEATPLAKTGGLADVCGALPIELSRLGHDVTLFLPAYRQARQAGIELVETGVQLSIPIGAKAVPGALLRGTLPGSEVTVYLVEQPGYFDRPGLYGEAGQDYIDNCERFVFFCRAVMESIRLLNLRADVLHLNDWQTALAAAYLKTEYRGMPGFDQMVSLFTIHNLAYQGRFWHWDMVLTGLDWKYFNWNQLEFFGDLCLIKAGLVFADALSTVSPSYAQEIQTPAQGCGLEGVLTQRRDVLHGIINGVDYSVWNPEVDRHLARPYGPHDVFEGKAANKAALQQDLGLPADPSAPLVGFVGRLVDQKGWNLLAPLLTHWAEHEEVQWAILGSGEPRYHDLLQVLARRFPQRIAVRTEFSDPLAHRIEAGSDLFVMPSLYEPCGLNQLYSLKYGTPPIVRRTGGLADSIRDASSEGLSNGTANGFTFDGFNVEELEACLRRACELYRQQADYRRLIENGMRQDWSWRRSAHLYAELYEQTLARVQRPIYS